MENTYLDPKDASHKPQSMMLSRRTRKDSGPFWSESPSTCAVQRRSPFLSWLACSGRHCPPGRDDKGPEGLMFGVWSRTSSSKSWSYLGLELFPALAYLS